MSDSPGSAMLSDETPMTSSRLVDLIVTKPLDIAASGTDSNGSATGGIDTFEAAAQGDWLGGFAHGGLVAAQALWSASATVPDGLRVHSLHAYFIGVGASDQPMTIRVTRLRDGRSFATRSAEVTQNGRLIVHLVSSFHRDEAGPDYQLGIDRRVPAPEDVAPSDHALMVRLRELRDLEYREIGPTPLRGDGTFRATRRAWVRIDAPLPDDPRLHPCILTVISDVGTVMAARLPIMRNVAWQSVGAASLDHTMWFHRPIRADAWNLYEIQTLSAQRSRSLIRGTMHAQSGELGVSLVQEVLIRPPSAAHAGSR